MLKGRVKQLSEAGLKAEYLCSSDLLKREPDLLVDKDTAAAFLPDDCQLDAHRTVAYIEKVCTHVHFSLHIFYFQPGGNHRYLNFSLTKDLPWFCI